MVDLSGSASQVAYNIFDEIVGPYVLVTYNEYKQAVNTVCRGTRWEIKQKNGISLKHRLFNAIRPHQRQGNVSLRLHFRCQLLQFDTNFNLITNGQHCNKEDWYYALTASPLKLEKGKIVLHGNELIMNDGASLDYKQAFRRNGLSLAKVSGGMAPDNDAIQDFDSSDEENRAQCDNAESGGGTEDKLVSAADIKAAVQKSLGDYKFSRQYYYRAQQSVDSAKEAIANEEDPDNVLGLFQTLQQYRANAVKTKKEMDENYVVLNTMREAISDCVEMLNGML